MSDWVARVFFAQSWAGIIEREILFRHGFDKSFQSYQLILGIDPRMSKKHLPGPADKASELEMVSVQAF